MTWFWLAAVCVPVGLIIATIYTHDPDPNPGKEWIVFTEDDEDTINY